MSQQEPWACAHAGSTATVMGRRPGQASKIRPFHLLVAIGLALLSIFGFGSPASAHTGTQSYIYLDVTENSLSGRAELPYNDLRPTLGLTLDGTDEDVLAELRTNLDALHNYAADHLVIGSNGQEWEINFGDPEIFFSDAPEEDDNYIILPFEVEVAAETVPREFDITIDLFFDEADDRDALLLIANDWQAGIIDNGSEDLATFDPDNRTQLIDLGSPSAFKNLVESGKLGVNHIRTGPDHILFVLVLLLPSVLVFSGGWKPAERFGSALWRVLKIVTMFTIAHSVTFTLAGFDLLPLSQIHIIEAIIALSIAAAALHNIRPVFHNREWLISFGFGLFHGLGFASLVSGLDVSRETQLWSLVGRNLGIELGQAVVILILFPMLFLLRRTQIYRPIFVGVSLLLTAIALIWMVERLFQTDLGINQYVDPVFEWPRSLYVIIALTVASGIYFLNERKAGRLLPTVGQVDEPVDREPVPA